MKGGTWIKICRFAAFIRAQRADREPRQEGRGEKKMTAINMVLIFSTRRNNKVTARTLAALIPSGRWNKAGGDLSLIWRHKIPCWKSQRAPAESINTNYPPPLKARINSTPRHHYQTADKMLEKPSSRALACLTHTHTHTHTHTKGHMQTLSPGDRCEAYYTQSDLQLSCL